MFLFSQIEAIVTVLNQLKPGIIDQTAGATDEVDDARRAIEATIHLGGKVFLTPHDLQSHRSKLKLAFVAEMFNACNGLPPIDADTLQAVNKAVRVKSSGRSSYRSVNGNVSSVSASVSDTSKRNEPLAAESPEVTSMFPTNRQAVLDVQQQHSASDSEGDDDTDYGNINPDDSLISASWNSPKGPDTAVKRRPTNNPDNEEILSPIRMSEGAEFNDESADDQQQFNSDTTSTTTNSTAFSVPVRIYSLFVSIVVLMWAVLCGCVEMWVWIVKSSVCFAFRTIKFWTVTVPKTVLFWILSTIVYVCFGGEIVVREAGVHASTKK